MKYIKQLSLITAIIFNFNSIAMDPPHSAPKENQIVHIKTSNGEIKGIERWKIEEMKTLLILLEDQKDNNSQNNPITASITSDELNLLSDCLTAIVNGEFDTFYANLIVTDTQLLKPGQPPISLEGGQLRTLINAAQKVQASGISAFCLSKIMPIDIQKKELVPQLINSIKQKIVPPTQNLAGHPAGVFAIAFNLDGNKIVSACFHNKNNLIVWDSITGQPQHILMGHPRTISAMALSPDGSKIVSGCFGNRNNLIVWDTITGQQQHVLIGHNEDISAVAFSPDGNKIVSASIGQQNNMIIWDCLTGQPQHILVGHPRAISAMALSPDGKKIVSGCWGNQNNLIIWDSSTGKQQHVLIGHPVDVTTVEFSPDSSEIVSGCDGDQNNLIIWDSTTGQQKHVLAGHPKTVSTAKFSPDGKKIVSGCMGSQNNLIIWNSATGQQQYILKGHPHNVSSVTFSPDGKKIASGCMSDQNNLIIWNSQTGQQQHVFNENLRGVRTTVFSPNGNKIASGSDGSLNNLILFSLLSAEEENVLDNCTFDQAQLLYQISLLSSSENIIQFKSPFIIKRLQSLSALLKNIVNKYFKVAIPITKSTEKVEAITPIQVQLQSKQKKLTQEQLHNQQLLEKTKADMRRYFTGPHLQTTEARIQAIQILKDIYTGIELQAFIEVVKEMGLSHILE